MTVYIALLAVVIGLMPVLLDKWRASHKHSMTPQRTPRRR
jgi:hypothetical protein